jgi:hypothetical protein
MRSFGKRLSVIVPSLLLGAFCAGLYAVNGLPSSWGWGTRLEAWAWMLTGPILLVALGGGPVPDVVGGCRVPRLARSSGVSRSSTPPECVHRYSHCLGGLLLVYERRHHHHDNVRMGCLISCYGRRATRLTDFRGGVLPVHASARQPALTGDAGRVRGFAVRQVRVTTRSRCHRSVWRGGVRSGHPPQP